MVEINFKYEENRTKELQQMIREREVEIELFKKELKYRTNLIINVNGGRNNENEP